MTRTFLPALLIGLLLPAAARAQCFSTQASELWPNHEVVYEIDRSALTRASMTSCLEANLVDDYQIIEAFTNTDTIEDWFLEGLDDWINGDPDLEQPLTFRERVGDETPYVLVTSLCDLVGGELGNMVSHSSSIPNHTGESVFYINLRPSTHEPARFVETVRHEIGHVLGMQHAQERPDRDNWVTVHPDSLNTDGYGKWGLSGCNYTLYNLPFDYSSIMMYPPRARGEGFVCTVEDKSGCEMLPATDDIDSTHFVEMENRYITTADRWALRLHYSWYEPDRVGLYNSRTSQYALATVASTVADGNAYATENVSSIPALSFTDFNGVFDRELESSSAVMLAGDWTDPVDGGSDYLGVAWLERSGRAWDLQVQQDLDEDMDGEDESPWATYVDGERIPFTGDFDGDPETAPGLGLYDAATDSFSYDSDSDGTLDTELYGFYSDALSPYPVAGDLMGNGYDSLCVLLRDWGAFVCDTDGDDVVDAGTWFTSRTGDDIYPIIGDWNGDGRDDLGIYDAGERVFELDRNNDFVITPLDEFGMSMDLVFTPKNSGTVLPEDVSLTPFAGAFAPEDIDRRVVNQPWKDAWCDTLEGVSMCDDPWVQCASLSESSGGQYSGVVCNDWLEYTFDEVPENCVWVYSNLECY